MCTCAHMYMFCCLFIAFGVCMSGLCLGLNHKHSLINNIGINISKYICNLSERTERTVRTKKGVSSHDYFHEIKHF